MQPQAFKGDYVDLKFIKTRKVAQVHIEIPIEEAAQFVAAFGAPNPASGVPIAMARIDLNAKEPEKTKRKWDELSIAQQAGIMCNEKGFQMFVKERLEKNSMGLKRYDEITVDDAAQYVRQQCGVNSRAHIEGKPEAERIFRDLRISYDNWLRVPA